MKMRPARFVALDQMCAWADAGEHESAGFNRSPLIDRINHDAGVPLASAYCASAIHEAFKTAGINDFGGPGCASVEMMLRWAAERGYLTSRPLRGDVGGWYLDGDGWADHAVMVRRVISWGGLLFTIQTVEANTSSGDAGSQSEGGGWYYRTRTIRRGRMKFARDPRRATRDPFKPKPKRKPSRPRAPRLIPRWAWRLDRWYATRPADRGPRPGPKKLPGWFWPWRRWRHTKR